MIIPTYPSALYQIVSNLVINSLRHGFEEKKGGRIVIKVSQRDDSIILRYFDNGKGISRDNLKRIFDPFYTTKRGQGGTGLGLHIVYNIVIQNLGGTIRCASREGGGALFTIMIPAQK